MKSWWNLPLAAALVWGSLGSGAAFAQLGGGIGSYNRPQWQSRPR